MPEKARVRVPLIPEHCDLQDHLVCFMGGTLALGTHNGLPPEHLELGKRLTRTCWEMYNKMPTGLSPEIAYFNMVPSHQDDIIVKVRVLGPTRFLQLFF